MAVTVNIPTEVSQTITDGVTNKAPSENVVFDALSLKESNIKDTNGKTWVIYGDSFSDEPNDYASLVASKLGLTATNYAVSGYRYSQALTLIQGQIAGNANFFDTFDYCSIHLGVNDFAGNHPLGTVESLSTDANVAGYLKKCIELVLTSNPLITLFIITPPEANGLGVNYKGTNTQGYTLAQLNNVISNICMYYGVQCIDLYNTANFNLFTIPTLTVDGLHPNTDGRELISNIVASAFRNMNSQGNSNNLTYSDLRIIDAIRKITLKDNTANSRFDVHDGTNAVISLVGNGRIGVNQTAPSHPIQVASVFAAQSDGVVRWGSNALSGNNRGSLSWDSGKATVNAQQALGLYSGGGERLLMDLSGNQVLGSQVALATNATNGFTYIPTCVGTPTGVPTAFTGKVPMVFDTTNGKLYLYSGGAWIAMN